MSDPAKKSFFDSWASKTIEEARKFLRLNFDNKKGVNCPCCGQLVKKYARSITAAAAANLINLVAMYENNNYEGYFHITEIGVGVTTGGDWAKLAYWRLIEEQPSTEDGKPSSGRWKPTQAGIDFVRGKTTVPVHAYIFDGNLFGFDTSKQINIHKALGTKFDYNELMKS
jgi:hypothetical protein